MRQITEVLRLNAQSLSYRQIAQSVGISASTVQSYLERAARAGLSWPLPVDLDDAAIEAQLFTRTEEELRAGRPEPGQSRSDQAAQPLRRHLRRAMAPLDAPVWPNQRLASTRMCLPCASFTWGEGHCLSFAADSPANAHRAPSEVRPPGRRSGLLV